MRKPKTNELFKNACYQSGFTENDLAFRLKVDPSTVYRWMRGQRPRTEFRLKLCKLLRRNEVELGFTKKDDFGEMKPKSRDPVYENPLKEKQGDNRSDYIVAAEAFDAGDETLLCAILSSRSRMWIESEGVQTLHLLSNIHSKFPPEHFAHLISHYCLGLSSLFSGNTISPEWFSRSYEEYAKKFGMNYLYRAERMELNRRKRNFNEALEIANTLIPIISLPIKNLDDNESYSFGVAHFLIANLLKEGGQFKLALAYIERARTFFKHGIPSHNIELVHCSYGKGICATMTGENFFEPLSYGIAKLHDSQLHAAFDKLIESHSHWISHDTEDYKWARIHAIKSAELFSASQFTKYASKSMELAHLLEWWENLEESNPLSPVSENPQLSKLVRFLVGHDSDIDWFTQTFRELRCSKALGLLQFANRFRKSHLRGLSLELPLTLIHEHNQLRIRETLVVSSLEDTDLNLREFLGIPIGRRVPLIADGI